MKKLLVIAALFCGIQSAQAIKIIYGPYLQAVTDTEATVVWVTDQKATSWVEVAPVDGTNFYNVERPKFYQTYLGKRVFGTEHQVRHEACPRNLRSCGYSPHLWQEVSWLHHSRP